ncbi:hypothetical protein Ocin01_11587 [Orchesella cincta]|uniref:Uncharacterized protein n=1 Tax=Orchesella cincta TaxID=48709 RepID=A0A1D2MPX6_ORCCI|nr:hypothetical protein Ocin01_11587 [Orchesella cincta]
MKQTSQFPFNLCLLTLVGITIQVFMLGGHVQGGIITNQDSLALPAELADAQIVAPPSTDKNNSRSGRVIYTAPYSNVRISSKEPKSLKYFPSATYTKKPPSTVTVAIVPVFEPSTTTTTKAATTATTTTTTTTTTRATSTSTTTSPPPSTPFADAIQQTLPEIIEIIDETEANNGDEVVTESMGGGSSREVGVTEENKSS